MKKLAALTLLLGLLTSLSTQAGTACNEKVQPPETVMKAFELGLQTRNALDASGAQVALVARVGQDLPATICVIRTWLLPGATIRKGAGW